MMEKKNSILYIHHHLGLGDHIICNGMVRHYADIHAGIRLFCKSKYLTNVEHMYRDLNNVLFHPIPTADLQHFETISSEQGAAAVFDHVGAPEGSELLRIGANNAWSGLYGRATTTFDQDFYRDAGLNPQLRFDKFYIKRDLAGEEKAYEDLNPTNEEYIYVHDDPSRGFRADPKKYRHDLKVIKNSMAHNMFNMRKILENATEIHTMVTGMLDFCNSIILEKPIIYLHAYMRPSRSSGWYMAKGLNRIEIIK